MADAVSGRVVLWNPAATDLFGYSAEEALALTLTELVDDLDATPPVCVWLPEPGSSSASALAA